MLMLGTKRVEAVVVSWQPAAVRRYGQWCLTLASGSVSHGDGAVSLRTNCARLSLDVFSFEHQTGQPCPRPTTRPAPPCHQVRSIMLPGPARPARPPGLPRPATQATQPAPLRQPASTPPPPCLPRPANHPVQARLRRCFFDENFMFRGHAYAVCRWQKFGHHKGCRHVCSRIREVIISNLCL